MLVIHTGKYTRTTNHCTVQPNRVYKARKYINAAFKDGIQFIKYNNAKMCTIKIDNNISADVMGMFIYIHI